MTDELAVTDATEARRFELRRADGLVGFATYHPRGDAVVVAHVETVVQHRGQGYANLLMAQVVGKLRREGRTVVPICPFAVDYFRRHPEDADVLHRD